MKIDNFTKLLIALFFFVLLSIILKAQPAMERYQTCVLFVNDWYEGKDSAKKELDNRQKFWTIYTP